MKPESRLTLIRKSKGLSQEALAEASGLSLRAVQRLEAGETTPRPHTVKVLAQALEVSTEELANNLIQSTGHESKDNQSAIRLVNFSAMLGLVVPLANIVVPLLVARKFKSAKGNYTVKQIVSFQLLWSLATLLAVGFTPILIKLFTETVAFGKLPPPALLVYGAMLLVNAGCTIHAAYRLRTSINIYSWVPPII